jgi:hypothetical protein
VVVVSWCALENCARIKKASASMVNADNGFDGERKRRNPRSHDASGERVSGGGVIAAR